MKEDFDLESVYDEQIFPLMQQIIEISKNNDLPFIASFQYSTEDGENHNFCSTANLPDTRPISGELNEIYRVLTGTRRRIPALNITTRDPQGNVTHIETIIP
jgi:hypothetical protein